MGTTKPLKIGVARAWREPLRPELQALVDAGHTVCEPADDCDLILHPKAWRWDEGFWPYLDVAVKQSQKLLPPRPKAAPKVRRARKKKEAT